jgi:hypothetical protein
LASLEKLPLIASVMLPLTVSLRSFSTVISCSSLTVTVIFFSL